MFNAAFQPECLVDVASAQTPSASKEPAPQADAAPTLTPVADTAVADKAPAATETTLPVRSSLWQRLRSRLRNVEQDQLPAGQGALPGGQNTLPAGEHTLDTHGFPVVEWDEGAAVSAAGAPSPVSESPKATPAFEVPEIPEPPQPESAEKVVIPEPPLAPSTCAKQPERYSAKQVRELSAAEQINAHQADAFFGHFSGASAKESSSTIPNLGKAKPETKPDTAKVATEGSRSKLAFIYGGAFVLLTIIVLTISLISLLSPIRTMDGIEQREQAAQSIVAPTSVDTAGALSVEKVHVISNNVPQNPDQGEFLTDGDVKTAWHSMSYSSPSLEKMNLDPVGFALELKEAQSVKSVDIYTTSVGGKFQVYTSDSPAMPSSEPLFEGQLVSPVTNVALPAGTKTKNIVIMFTELPVDQGVRLRANINEVVLK